MAAAAQPGRTSFLFDLDGTLVDSTRGITNALAAAFQSVGRTMPLGLLRTAIGPPIRMIVKRLEPELSDADTEAIERAYRDLYDRTEWRGTSLFPAVLETLHTLRAAGHQLLLVTNKPRVPAGKILAHLSLRELLEDVVTRDSVRPMYPGKREMLTILLERHQLSAGACVMVGDTAEDEDAARANGIPFAFVTYGYGQAIAADYRLDNIAELLAIAGLSDVPAGALSAAGGRR